MRTWLLRTHAHREEQKYREKYEPHRTSEAQNYLIISQCLITPPHMELSRMSDNSAIEKLLVLD